MCGRYTVFTEDEIRELRQIINEVNERLSGTLALATMATKEVRPTNIAPVLTADGATLMRWGFPRWDGKGVVINARAETVPVKPMFRESYEVRRCVIPSAGFYEWSHGPGRKTKYLCRLPGMQALMMAGIYKSYTDEHGNKAECYVILTSAPSKSIAAIHDRMPVILMPDELNVWTNNQAAAHEILRRSGPELELIAIRDGGGTHANNQVDPDHVQISYLGSDGSSGL